VEYYPLLLDYLLGVYGRRWLLGWEGYESLSLCSLGEYPTREMGGRHPGEEGLEEQELEPGPGCEGNSLRTFGDRREPRREGGREGRRDGGREAGVIPFMHQQVRTNAVGHRDGLGVRVKGRSDACENFFSR